MPPTRTPKKHYPHPSTLPIWHYAWYWLIMTPITAGAVVSVTWLDWPAAMLALGLLGVPLAGSLAELIHQERYNEHDSSPRRTSSDVIDLLCLCAVVSILASLPYLGHAHGLGTMSLLIILTVLPNMVAYWVIELLLYTRAIPRSSGLFVASIGLSKAIVAFVIAAYAVQADFLSLSTPSIFFACVALVAIGFAGEVWLAYFKRRRHESGVTYEWPLHYPGGLIEHCTALVVITAAGWGLVYLHLFP